MPWDTQTERTCRCAIETVCDDAAPRGDRERAWHTLLEQIGPEIEAWATRSPILRHAKLATSDHARAVLVAAIERLSNDDFANLRRFLARQPAPVGDADVIDQVAKLAEEAPEHGTTPLRAWLRTLVRYLERDLVRRRLGTGAAHDKRSVTTDADPLPTDGLPGERPPITDALALAALLTEIKAYVQTFPHMMRRAIECWLEDAAPDEIAAELGLEDARRAHALVRAGQARLRDRFRERMPALFES